VTICAFDLWKSYWPVLLTLSVSLTLEVGDRLMRITHRLIIVNNCGKYLQNPFKDKKVMDRTQHIPSNRKCWPWMSKCDLDPGGKGLVVAYDTSSYYNKYLCQVISNSFDKCYGPETEMWWTDGQKDGQTDWLTDRQTEPISISPIFLRKGGGQFYILHSRLMSNNAEIYILHSWLMSNNVVIIYLTLTIHVKQW
jgi:hypothetical protein